MTNLAEKYSRPVVAALTEEDARDLHDIREANVSPGRVVDHLARFRLRYAGGGSDREPWVSETCYHSGVQRAVSQWGSSRRSGRTPTEAGGPATWLRRTAPTGRPD